MQYGISFNKIDVVQNKIDELLAIVVGKNESQAYTVFNKLRNFYPSNEGEPEVVIDLLDDEWSVIEDYALTYKNAVELAQSMGWDLELGVRI